MYGILHWFMLQEVMDEDASHIDRLTRWALFNIVIYHSLV